MGANSDEDESATPDGLRPIEGALAELIELEAEIEARVAQAEADAARIVDDARRRAETAEAEGHGSLEQAERALRTSIDREAADSMRELAERAEREAERYRGVDEATLARLSRWVASRVLPGSESA